MSGQPEESNLSKTEDEPLLEKQNDEAVSEEPKGRALSDLRRITIIAIAIAIVIFIYFVIADRTTPFSGDAQVQAFVLRVAPEINGNVKSVNIIDNQIVDPEELLFEIDPRPFESAVAQAQARLEQAGQNVGASTASVELAQARVEEARANEVNIRAQSGRVLELVKRGVYAKARQDNAIAKIEAARAAVESAEADLRRAKQELGTTGENNPQIREALAALEKAQYDLSRTTILAPSRGVVTNLQLTTGQTVVAGQQVMTFLSAEDVWLLASIRENSLGVLKAGQPAEVVLDTLPGQVYSATVQSIGWGVGSGKVDPATGLPTSTDDAGWLTDPLRFPVQFVFDKEKLPKGARYGSRAAVIVYAAGNPVMNALAWIRIRMIALLTYVS
jgi:multidrug resistance efflux pump